MAIISGIGGAGITPDPELSVTSAGTLQIGSTGNQGSVVLFGASTGSVQVNSASTGTSFNINAGYASPAPTTLLGFATSVTITTSTPSIIINNSVNLTMTFPSATAYPGFIFKMKNLSVNAVSSATSNIVLLSGGAAGTPIFVSAAANKWAEIQSDATNWQFMSSN